MKKHASQLLRPFGVTLNCLALLALTCATTVIAQAKDKLGPDDLTYTTYGPSDSTSYSEFNTSPAGTHGRTIENDDHLIKRRYVVYIPANLPNRESYPLVIMLHGTSGTGEQYYNISGWREKADAVGFVVAFPSSLAYPLRDKKNPITKWHEYGLMSELDLNRTPPGYPADAPLPADDISFLRDMIGDLTALLPIDRDRIHIAGFSVGAGLALRASAEMGDVVASVTAHASFHNDLHPTLHNNRNMSVYLSFGSNDDRGLEAINAKMPTGVHIKRIPQNPVAIFSTPVLNNSIYTYISSLGLDPRSPTDYNTSPHVTEIRWANPAAGNTDGNEAFFSVLEGVGHIYPSGQVKANGAQHEKNLYALNVVDRAWAFFVAHPKP